MDASDIIQQKKRQTAYKLRIADLNKGDVISNEKGNFIEIDGKHVARVNVIANVIDKFVSVGEKRYAALTIDDASSQIRIKTFGDDIAKMENIEIGDTIVVVGALRFFNNEIYILPEIIQRVEPERLLLRKLEIEKNRMQSASKEKSQNTSLSTTTAEGRVSSQLRNFKPTKAEERLISNIAFNTGVNVGEEKIESGETKKATSELSARDRVLDMLRQNDEGVDREQLIMSINLPVEDINNAVEEMLENAEIYEPKPGRIRLL